MQSGDVWMKQKWSGLFCFDYPFRERVKCVCVCVCVIIIINGLILI